MHTHLRNSKVFVISPRTLRYVRAEETVKRACGDLGPFQDGIAARMPGCLESFHGSVSARRIVNKHSLPPEKTVLG